MPTALALPTTGGIGFTAAPVQRGRSGSHSGLRPCCCPPIEGQQQGALANTSRCPPTEEVPKCRLQRRRVAGEWGGGQSPADRCNARLRDTGRSWMPEETGCRLQTTVGKLHLRALHIPRHCTVESAACSRALHTRGRCMFEGAAHSSALHSRASRTPEGAIHMKALHSRASHTPEGATHMKALHSRTSRTPEGATHMKVLHSRASHTPEGATHMKALHTSALEGAAEPSHQTTSHATPRLAAKSSRPSQNFGQRPGNKAINLSQEQSQAAKQ
eukprot:365031-Chlamydomonas_euryale.AAC.13